MLTLQFLKKEKVSADAYSFYFEKRDVEFNFLPGQYLRMTLNVESPDERGNSRFFTIASSPTEQDYLMITTRVIQSTFKKTLVDLKPGQQVQFDGPFGNFVLNETDKTPRVFLAGGIGITPFRSMIVYVRDRRFDIPITLLVSFSRSDDVVYLEELKNIQSSLSNFRLIMTVTKPELSSSKWDDETGRIDEEKLKKYIRSLNEPIYYISGPGVMVEAMSSLVRQLGVDPQKIKTEVFPGY